MISEGCPSIVDWLSDVEASLHSQESSTRDSSLTAPSLTTPSLSIPSLSTPSLTDLQHPRKRKHKHQLHTPQAYIKRAHFDKRTRKPLCEIMEPNSTKRRRTDATSENEEQSDAVEVPIISADTVLSSFLTITNSMDLVKRLTKASPPHRPSPSYAHPRPPCLPGPTHQKPQVAPERRVHLR